MPYKIAVIGLGYVGLPLAVEFAKKYRVTGYDINTLRVSELNLHKDHTLEVDTESLKNVMLPSPDSGDTGLTITSCIDDISTASIFIITVPTPTDKNNRPVLTPLRKASEAVGSVLKKGDYVIYESTVYPGATEED